MIIIVILYILIMNIVAFTSMGYDKKQARKGKRRLSEKRLFTYAVIGGALGGWFGMQTWRHKTKHLSFVIGMPLLVIANLACLYFAWRLFGNQR
jgi:uncharacterized membrane protein YsdA (DUF1294 family)